ncbi:MAG: DUF2157 domain-containing protein [Usitatibacteraceae bacterium]
MLRSELDHLNAQHHFSAAQISQALSLTGNRPDANAWRQFAITLLRAAGIGGIGAGIIFFVAANWQDYGVMGRFLLLQIGIAAMVAIALWKPPHAETEKYALGAPALLLATLLTGGLLALFGQTYQTGADVYELFFLWALLTLPFAVAAMSGALWALWWVVLNIALMLYCGWSGPTDNAWALFDRMGFNKATALMLPFAVNLGGATVAYALADRASESEWFARLANAAPIWFARMLLAFAFVFGVSACVFVIFPQMSFFSSGNKMAMNTGVLLVFFFACVGVVVLALKQKRDVFPLAVIAGSFVVISTTFITKVIKNPEIGTMFVIAAWLIATSTAAAFVLMHYVRAWRAQPGTDAKPQPGTSA